MNQLSSSKPTTIINFKLLAIMKHRTLIGALLLFSSFAGILAQDKCPNVVVIRKSLYDSFQRVKADVGNLERSLTKAKQVRDNLYRQYRECEHQGDIEDMLKQRDADVHNLENSLNEVNETNKLVDQHVRRILHDANGIPVVYRFYDSGYGNLGRVWTMTFSSQDGKIVVVPTYYQLLDPVARTK
jgi:hypothetical protein